MSRFADVTVVQPVPFMPGLRPLPEWAAAHDRALEGLQVRHAPMFYVPGVLKSLDASWLALSVRATIERLHAESPLDAIDAHFGYPDGAGCAAVAKRFGVPLFITIRGNEQENAVRPFVGSRMLAAMRAATGCIPVSHSLAALAARHGVAPERTRVIHNAIDASVFNHGPSAEARAALGIEPDRKLVVSVGHLIERKRHHVLLEAFAALRRDFPRALLVVVGARSSEPAYPARLSELALRLGIADHVRFAGNLAPPSVATWLRAADVFALATAREGCCNAVLEALATGVPVVTTPVGDNAHFVADGVNGHLAAVDDVEALAAGLRRALAAAWDRPAIAAALHAQAGSWADVGERVVDFMSERLRKMPAAASALQYSVH